MSKNDTPIRMCCGCMERKPKDEFIKIIRADGKAFIDLSKRRDGRGAYVCVNENCIKIAKKKRAFSRNLKCEIEDNLYDELLKLADGK